MKEFILIFRNEHQPDENLSPQEMDESIKKWQNWLGGIAAQDKFVGGNKLNLDGKSLTTSGEVIDGPYAEIKEILVGYFVVKAENLEQAFILAQGCPILEEGGKVEVRGVMGGPKD